MSYNAWVFTLGTEVVQGRIINSNAAFIGRRLTLLGFNVLGVITLIDDVDLIAKHLLIILSENPRVIITTGGLGPTYDDRTLEAIAKAINKRLILNQEAFEFVKNKYMEKGQELTSERIKMAYLPEGAIPIPNPIGTAPGSWLEVGGTVVVSLPGVPREMEAMWSTWVEPRLRLIGPGLYIAEKTVVIDNVPEASLAPVVKDVLKLYPEIYIKTHPKGDEVGKQVLEVYVMHSHKVEKEAKALVEKAIDSLRIKFRERYGVELNIIGIRDKAE